MQAERPEDKPGDRASADPFRESVTTDPGPGGDRGERLEALEKRAAGRVVVLSGADEAVTADLIYSCRGPRAGNAGIEYGAGEFAEKRDGVGG